jgi:hypothetical protein
VLEQKLDGSLRARDAGRGDYGKIVDRDASIEKKPHFVKIVDRPKERGRAILATRMDFRTTFEKNAHHLHVRD